MMVGTFPRVPSLSEGSKNPLYPWLILIPVFPFTSIGLAEIPEIESLWPADTGWFFPSRLNSSCKPSNWRNAVAVPICLGSLPKFSKDTVTPVCRIPFLIGRGIS
jgi:hypothetical protein